MVTGDRSEERLLREKPLSGRQRGVVGRHETHARATRNEIAVNDRECSLFVMENVRVREPGLFLHHLLSLLCSRADDPVYGADGRDTVLVADVILE